MTIEAKLLVSTDGTINATEYPELASILIALRHKEKM